MCAVCQICRQSHCSWSTRSTSTTFAAARTCRAAAYAGGSRGSGGGRLQRLLVGLCRLGEALLLDRPHDGGDPQDEDDGGGDGDTDAWDADGLEQRLGVGQDDQATGRGAEDACGEVLDQPRGDGGGDHTADEQRAGVAPVDAGGAEADEEAERATDSDDELGRVDRADDLAGLETAAGEQRRGADG